MTWAGRVLRRIFIEVRGDPVRTEDFAVHLKAHHRLVALLVAVPGFLICLGAIALFLEQVVNNRVLGPMRGNERQYYLAVGDAYSGGFVTGFFRCFFLMIMGIAAKAYLIAGTSLMGGRGSVVNSLFGVLIIAVLNSGLAAVGAKDETKRLVH